MPRRRRDLAAPVVDERLQTAAVSVVRWVDLHLRVPTSDVPMSPAKRQVAQCLAGAGPADALDALERARALGDELGLDSVGRLIDQRIEAWLATDGHPWCYRAPEPIPTKGVPA